MDEERAEQTSGESGSRATVVSRPLEPQDEPVAALAEATTPELPEKPVEPPVLLQPSDVESPLRTTEPTAVAEISEPTACAAPKVEVEKNDAATDAPAAEAEAPLAPGKLIVLAARDRNRAHHGGDSPKQKRAWMLDARRVAAVVALATAAGALGGAMATAGLMRAGGHAAGGNHALEASVARIDAEISALKAGLENNSRLAANQSSKASDRLDRIEKAQAEPAKLTKLSEVAEKLRAAPVPLPSPPPVAASATTTGAKEVTGSVTPSPAPAKTEVGRLPTVEGWVLRDVAYGGALIEGRHGVYEVYAGDPVPGLGRVDAIRRQDGRWVVVTSRGLIVAR
jgi:hypothetical protein